MSKCEDLRNHPNAVALFLNAVLQKISLYTQHLDIQSNITVALSGLVFVFSASRLTQLLPNNFSCTLAVLAISSCLSAIVGLLAVNPPNFMRKKGQVESLLYHSKIAKYASAEPYYQDFIKILSDQDRYIAEITKEIYNLSRFSYLPKRFLSNCARNILITGFTFSSIIFLIHIFTGLF